MENKILSILQVLHVGRIIVYVARETGPEKFIVTTGTSVTLSEYMVNRIAMEGRKIPELEARGIFPAIAATHKYDLEVIPSVVYDENKPLASLSDLYEEAKDCLHGISCPQIQFDPKYLRAFAVLKEIRNLAASAIVNPIRPGPS